jgi:hypothetical protein
MTRASGTGNCFHALAALCFGALLDDRGYIYIVDRANTGLHILRLTGAGREAAGLPR